MRLHKSVYNNLKDPLRRFLPASHHSDSQHVQCNARSHRYISLPIVTDGEGFVEDRGFGPTGLKPHSLQSASARLPCTLPFSASAEVLVRF